MNNLKSLRGTEHQSSFVLRLGIPYITGPVLSLIETGKVMPIPEDAQKIADTLGVSFDAVWGAPIAVHGKAPEKRTEAFINGADAKNCDYLKVTQHIPVGRANSVSRAVLVSKTGYDDRTVRGMIERARRNGEFILSIGKGYRYSDDPAELARYDSIERSRALSILIRLAPIRHWLDRNMPGQMIERCWRCGDEATGDFCENCETILSKREAAVTSAKATTAKE